MKKLIRFLFPLILVIAIIGCSVWYVFEYDREFTRDMLLTAARYFEGQGNRSVAASFYSLAYSHSGDNDAVAIELANQYKASGNYTKAEFTLSNAIKDGGDIELYIELSKIYVEQDKLLDAVSMLGGITNQNIKAKLEALRPAAPTVSVEPGFYSQYVLVDVLSDGGTLYVTTDGEYPSTAYTPYEEPIQLVLGENKLIALSVGENGLVSSLSTFAYIVGGVIEEVSFEDAAVDTAVREILGKSDDDTIFTNELWDILEFNMPADAKVYTDLKHLSSLEKLTINGGVASELHNVSSLSHLSSLSIYDCTVSEEALSKIAALPMLKELTLHNCGVSSVTALAEADGLTLLNLSSNAVRNLKPLSNLNKLQDLNLQHNAVTDLSALSSLPALQKLDVSYNTLTSIVPVTTITGLTWLNAGTNNITELGELNKLTSLSYLSLEKNGITDISMLSNCTALEELNVSNNSIADISSLNTLNKLVYFNFSNNAVAELPQWDPSCSLVTIDGTNNMLSSIDILGNFKALNNVYMDYNIEISSVEALAACPMLIQVNVYGTKVTNVEMLTSQSVIVNYNPVQDTADEA